MTEHVRGSRNVCAATLQGQAECKRWVCWLNAPSAGIRRQASDVSYVRTPHMLTTT